MNLAKWNGNLLSFADSDAKYIMIALGVIFICFLLGMSLFSTQIRGKYLAYIRVKKNAKIIYLLGATFAFGLSLLFIFRLIIFTSPGTDGENFYPFFWELVPLHFSRLSLIINIFVLFLPFVWQKKTVVYYGIFSLVTGAMAIFSPDLSGDPARYGIITNWGLDSFTYWDYVTVHLSNVIIPWLIFLLYRPKITFKIALWTAGGLVLYLFVLFFLNLILDSQSARWQSNWGYLGSDAANPFLKNLVPPLTFFPQHVFVFSILFASIQLASIAIYLHFPRLQFSYKNHHFSRLPKDCQLVNYYHESMPLKIRLFLKKMSAKFTRPSKVE